MVQMLRLYDVVRPGRLQLSMEQMGVGYHHLGQSDPSMGYPSFSVSPHGQGRCSVTENVVLRARLPLHEILIPSLRGRVA